MKQPVAECAEEQSCLVNRCFPHAICVVASIDKYFMSSKGFEVGFNICLPLPMCIRIASWDARITVGKNPDEPIVVNHI